MCDALGYGAAMTMTVLVEKTAHGRFRAMTSQPIALAVEADSAANAVSQLKEEIEDRLSTCEVVELDIRTSRREHPWLRFAGIWKENPEFAAHPKRSAATIYRAAG